MVGAHSPHTRNARRARLDDTYQTYLNRLARTVLPATYQSGVQHIQESPKYEPDAAGGRRPIPFPGLTVITPPWEEDAENTSFYKTLQECQQQLLEQLPAGMFVPVPPESFHFTLADLIWDGAYRHASQNPEFDSMLRQQITASFSHYTPPPPNSPPQNPNNRWQLLGLMLSPRATGVCLIPKDEHSYEQIVQLRRAIYQNPDLIGLGIEQQYHFSGHITLGYFGDIPPNLDRSQLATTLFDLTQKWLQEEPHELSVQRAELRKFDDMTRYYRAPDWPSVQF
jgi:hypothetical protein